MKFDYATEEREKKLASVLCPIINYKVQDLGFDRSKIPLSIMPGFKVAVCGVLSISSVKESVFSVKTMAKNMQ
ncbi:hypothetical protein CUMW_194070 [Citrus unshiu]|nr:hypothetical protein CUMW_194070 [Citrus unshiu]